MATYNTLGDVLDEIDAELDLTGQDDVADSICTLTEKINYVNRAIRVVEKEIHTLGREEVYFRARQPLQLATGQQNYGLPTNIFANKILKILYHNGTVIYEIRRMRRLSGRSIYEQAAYIDQFGSADFYQYMLRNDGVNFQTEIWLYPNSRETAPTAVDSDPTASIWYIRQANTVSERDDIIDVPESIDYVKQFYKCRVLAKQFRGVVPEGEVELLNDFRDRFVAALREMVPDDNNQIEQDMSFYQDFDSYPYSGSGQY